VDRDWLSSVLG